MKKKVALTAAAVALVGTLAVGGTLAWFTDTETATNVVTMGEVDIVLSEMGGENGVVTEEGLSYDDVMPGDTFKKTVTIKNLENDAFVRAIVTVHATDIILSAIEDGNGPVFKGLGTNVTWTVDQEAGTATATVVYNEIMTKDSEAWTVFSNIEIPTSWGNEFVGEKFNIKVDAQAIQADNLTAMTAWGAFDEITGETDLGKTLVKGKYDSIGTAVISSETN